MAQAWFAYTVQLMRTAGEFDDHHFVEDLCKRHEKYRVHFENRDNLGLAYFNLERRMQAASAWERLNQIYNFSIPRQWRLPLLFQAALKKRPF